jgi:uncharacterized membrane protein YdbT with pleckstrin-like domain
MPNERILYRTQLHWVVYLRALAEIAMGIVFMFLALGTSSPRGVLQGVGGLFCLTGGFVVFTGILDLVRIFIVIRTTEFALTTKRVMGKRGFIRRHSLELLLSQVESISVDQPITGRLLNYGTVTVIGTGGTRERFPLIVNPLEFRRRVQQQLARGS